LRTVGPTTPEERTIMRYRSERQRSQRCSSRQFGSVKW
jgi:hypothetical protein